MLTVILLGSAIICYFALLLTYKPQAKYKNGMLFAVTLPEHAMDHEEVRNIQARFNKKLKQASLWSGISLLPLVLLHAWSAYQTVYFLVWFSVFMIVIVIPFRHAFRELLALKREKDWFVGTKRVIQSDLRVARLKNQRLASPWLFMIPFAMSIGLNVWVTREEMQFLGIGVTGFVLTLVFFFVSFSMRRTKAKVYSMNSDVNLSLNQFRRRALSYLWLFLAIIENIHMLFVYFLAFNETEALFGVWVTIVLLFSAIPIGLSLYVYRKVSTVEQEVLAEDGKIIYTDDDEYWANGFTYHNPNDTSILVTKRIGIGETINTGTLVGKIVMGGTVGIVFLMIFGISFMLIRSELTSPTLMITAEDRIEINYPMYSYDFDIANIEQLSLVDDVPSGMKTNGEATAKYSRGRFKLKELGTTRLYIFKNNPPYIKIQLEDSYIFYNDEDPLQTEQLFEQLQQQVNNPNQTTINDNPIESISPTEILSELADQEYPIKGDLISEADFDDIVSFGQAFVNLYTGAVAEQETVSFENYISNANLLTFTNKMLELEQKLESKGALGVNFGVDNEFEEEEFEQLDENLYSLKIPYSYEGSGITCTLLVQSVDQNLEIVDFYFGYKDGVDTITTGHPAVRKINNAKLWDDQEWVDDVFDKLEQYESELNS